MPVQFDLENGVTHVVQKLKKELENKSTFVLAIAGGSSSGKTSKVTETIRREFEDETLVLSADRYYRGLSFKKDYEKKYKRELTFDEPAILDLPLMAKHIDSLKKGDPIEAPIYDFKKSDRIGYETLRPKTLIIAEGLFVLEEEILPAVDYSVFVEIGTYGRMLRRVFRDVERTGETPNEILGYFARVVEPMHEKYIEARKHYADVHIVNEFNEHTEGMHHAADGVQRRFIQPDDIDKRIADGMRTVVQQFEVDYYFRPKDRNMLETGEVLRIRQVDGRFIFTYKGPVKETCRGRYDFDIDDETFEQFLESFGYILDVTISKRRKILHRGSTMFSIDTVWYQYGSTIRPLGKFIELHLSPHEAHEKQLYELGLIQDLGLIPELLITDSYHHMAIKHLD